VGISMNVIFLDYDGVVNNVIWYYDKDGNLKEGFEEEYPPTKVNDFQAVCWVSELCRKFNAKIVVSSVWRHCRPNWKEVLYNGGLDPNIEVIGKTPHHTLGRPRGEEIQEWLDEHPEVENFIIIDDDSDMVHLKDHLVKYYCYDGFTYGRFIEARRLFEKILKK